MRTLARLRALIPGQARPPRDHDPDAAHRATAAGLLDDLPHAYAVVRSTWTPTDGWRDAALIGYARDLDTAVDATVRLNRCHGSPAVRFETCTLSVVGSRLCSEHAVRTYLAGRPS